MRIEHILDENNTTRHTDTYFYKTYGEDVLFHSSKNRGQEGFVPFKFRASPRDSFMPFHNEANMLAKQKFGLPVRSLMFAMNSKQGAANYNLYGKPYAVYPVSSKFRMFYSKNTTDMTEDLYATSTAILDKLNHEVGVAITDIYDDRGEPADEAIVKMTRKSVEKVMRNVFNSDDRRNTSNGLELFFDKVLVDMLSYMKGRRFNDAERERVSDVIKKFRTKYQNTAFNYVNSIVEVKSLLDIVRADDHEIMVYDPEGFFFI